MPTASKIIFRKITGADFFNIYKAPGAEVGGGGQSYIDVDTSGVPVSAWESFFSPVKPELKAQDFPAWDIDVHSIGLGKSQKVTIAQRRETSVSIRAQKLGSSRSNRIYAWHPVLAGFPSPTNPPNSSNDPTVAPLIHGLVVYLIRDTQGVIWAGWFKRSSPVANWFVDKRLLRMFSDGDGIIEIPEGIGFDETDLEWPFGRVAVVTPTESPEKKLSDAAKPVAVGTPVQALSEEEIANALFNDDQLLDLPAAQKVILQKIRVRNSAAVKLLKELYGGKCQITGDEFIFIKSDGKPYTEAHHLIPLGSGGADSPLNLVIVSALAHKMLHYANVSPIDLNKIKDNKLEILINQKKYTITWHQKHAEMIAKALKKTPPGA